MLSAARLAGLAGLLWATAHQPPPNGVSAEPPGEVGADGRRRDRLAGLDGQPPAPGPGAHDVVLPRPPGRVGRRPRRVGPHRHHLHGRRRARCRDRLRGAPGAGRGSDRRRRTGGGHAGAWVLPGSSSPKGRSPWSSGSWSAPAGANTWSGRSRPSSSWPSGSGPTPNGTERPPWPSATASDARSTTCWPTPSGALSVQLDAADALLENGDDPAKARQLVQAGSAARRPGARGDPPGGARTARRAGGPGRATGVVGRP